MAKLYLIDLKFAVSNLLTLPEHVVDVLIVVGVDPDVNRG
jgi:hypothetical protein